MCGDNGRAGNARLDAVALDQLPESLAGEGPRRAVRNTAALLPEPASSAARGRQIAFEPADGFFTHGDQSLLVALAQNADDAHVETDLSQGEVRPAPDTRSPVA